MNFQVVGSMMVVSLLWLQQH